MYDNNKRSDLEFHAIKRNLDCCLTALNSIKNIVSDMSKYIEQNIDDTKQIIDRINK